MASRKGSPNRNRQFLLNRLQDMYGEEFHPVMRMADNANKLDEIASNEPDSNNLKASIDAWDKIAQYVQPKLKAMELTGEDGGAIAVTNVQRTVVKHPDS